MQQFSILVVGMKSNKLHVSVHKDWYYLKGKIIRYKKNVYVAKLVLIYMYIRPDFKNPIECDFTINFQVVWILNTSCMLVRIFCFDLLFITSV